MIFHAVNGDKLGNGRLGTAQSGHDVASPLYVNKGDRGYSDQAEARVFHIGQSHRDHPRR
jgi:hypothetical protein